MATRSGQRELLESIALSALGIAGIVAGLAALLPTPTVAKPAPSPAELGMPEGGWPQPAAHAESVVDYVIEAKLDPEAHTIDGRQTVTLRNVADVPLSELRLHLYLNAFKNDATVFRRARVGGFRGDSEGAPGFVDVRSLIVDGKDIWPSHVFVSHRGESPQDPLRPFDSQQAGASADTAPDDETDVRVPLPSPISPGAKLTFTVDFHDLLPEVSERTGYHGSFHFAGQWFPKLAKLERDGKFASFPFHHLGEFYADFGSYDVTIDVPERFVVGATGTRVSSQRKDGRLMVRHTQSDVHDFAWTAWDKFDERQADVEGVRVTVLTPRGHAAIAERELTSVRQGLFSYGARYGAYPYPVLTVVHPPSGAGEAGGMEYPTLITTGGDWSPAFGAHDIETVTVHELGHQWFYGLLGTHEVEWPAGDEGFNSFGELGAMRDFFGDGSAFSSRTYALDELGYLRGGMTSAQSEPVFQAVPRFSSGRAYFGRVYGATATVLETLRRTFGPRFSSAMGVYARRYRFGHPTQEDFFATLEAVAGKDVAEPARVALTQPGGFDVAVDSLHSGKARTAGGYFEAPTGRAKRDSTELASWASAAWISRRGAVDLPIDVELRFADGSRRREIVRFDAPATPTSAGTSNWRRIDADGPSELVAVLVDPDRKLLIDVDRTNDFATSRAARGGTPIANERAPSWMQTLLRLVGP